MPNQVEGIGQSQNTSETGLGISLAELEVVVLLGICSSLLRLLPPQPGLG